MYKRLVISGGGSKAPLALGALLFFIEKEELVLSDIDQFAGSSIGSVLNFLILCRFKIDEILQYTIDMKGELFDVKYKGILEMLNNFGAMSMDKFMNHIQKLIEKKGWKKFPTFKEFYETEGFSKGKTFVVTGVNLSKFQVEYYSYWSTPHMNIVDALKRSCNLPFIFEKITAIDGHHTDGGLGNNLPVEMVDDGKSKVLALNMTTIDPFADFKNESLSSYFLRLISFPIIANTFLRRKQFGPNVEVLDLFSRLPNEIVKKKKSKDTRNNNQRLELFKKLLPENTAKQLSKLVGDTKFIEFEQNKGGKLDLFIKGYIQAANFERNEYIFLNLESYNS